MVPDAENDLRKQQLRELAVLNGTLREDDALLYDAFCLLCIIIIIIIYYVSSAARDRKRHIHNTRQHNTI